MKVGVPKLTQVSPLGHTTLISNWVAAKSSTTGSPWEKWGKTRTLPGSEESLFHAVAGAAIQRVANTPNKKPSARFMLSAPKNGSTTWDKSQAISCLLFLLLDKVENAWELGQANSTGTGSAPSPRAARLRR